MNKKLKQCVAVLCSVSLLAPVNLPYARAAETESGGGSD